MAHLLEHMLFKGTPDHPNIPKVLQERGARFNGTTWVDRTNYYETLPAEGDNLEFALKLEADRMINSFVRAEDLFSEMTVVRNEFEQGENSPSSLLQDRMMAVAFDWHNYGKSTIGNRSDIERVPIGNLRAFFQKHYQPDNAVLVVAGKFDEATALKLISETFGRIARPTRELPRTYTDEPPQDGERTVTLRRVGDVGLAGAIYHTPAGAHPDSAALEVLASALDAPPSGRLYKALVESRKATSVSTVSFSWHDAGVFAADAEVRKADPIDPVLATMIEVVESVGREGLPNEDVDRAKQQILKRREMSSAETSRVAVQLSDWAAKGDWRLYFYHRDNVEKVTTDDIQRVAAKYLQRNNRTTGTFIPSETSGRVTIPDRPDPAKLLAGYTGRSLEATGEEFDPTPQNLEQRVQRTQIPPHIQVALLPKKTRGETVQVYVTLRYGGAESLRGFESAADFLPLLMTRGTRQLSRQQLQDELDRRRATLSARGDTGEAFFTIVTKRSELVPVLELLRAVLREPSLPADEFETMQRRQIASLEEQFNDPAALAGIYVRRTANPYPATDVRYIPTLPESIARATAVNREQVAQLYREFLGARGEVAVVGDFEPAPVMESLQQIFADWEPRNAYKRIPRVAFTNVSGGLQRIDTPDKANATYMAGYVFAMKDTDPDYPAMLLSDFVLGGGSLSSRLGDRVRQKDGLSYGVGSSFAADTLDARASFTLYAICNPQNMPKVVAAVKEECERLIKEGVTADELERAKQGYLRQMQIRRTSDRSLAAMLVEDQFANRTFTYYSDLEDRIGKVKPQEITAALSKHIDLQRLIIATAGDFSGDAGKANTTK
jgi:zinc protease